MAGAAQGQGLHPLWRLLALLLLLHADTRCEGRLSPQDFSQLTHRFREGGERLSDAEFHLLFEQINTMFWNSPDSVGAGASGLANATYSVVLHEIPPFVRISDLEGAADPGNANQTRTSRNGGVSGITIDVLNLIEYHTGASFQYYYPCRRSDVRETGKCDAQLVRMANASLAMLDSGLRDEQSDFFGGGRALCGAQYKCISAGAHKISEGLLLRYFLTQPMMMTGYRLVTLSKPVEPSLFDWASPFDYLVWIFVAAEILICGLSIYLVEFQADNDSLSINPLKRLWDTMYYSLTLVLVSLLPVFDCAWHGWHPDFKISRAGAQTLAGGGRQAAHDARRTHHHPCAAVLDGDSSGHFHRQPEQHFAQAAIPDSG